MTVSNVPVFAVTPKTNYASPTTAFALTGAGSMLDDNPSNTVLLATAGANGALVTNVSVIPRATCTAHFAAIFLSKDSGTTKKLLSTVLVAAQTLSTTTAVVEYVFTIATESLPLRLEAGDRLYVGVSVTQANGVNFISKTVDY
jgi:hypothetical protein